MNSISQGKEIILFRHPTWLHSRDHTKPGLDWNIGKVGDTYREHPSPRYHAFDMMFMVLV
jgi:hypothetical protein